MSQRSTFCIATSRGRADHIVNNLKGGGLPPESVSILFIDPAVRKPDKPIDPTPDPTPGSTATIRGVMTWITGIKPFVVAGVAPCIGSGPVASAVAGVIGGGIANGLIEFGVPQAEAGRYETAISDGHTLIAVHSANPETADQAREIFTAAAAEDIFTMMSITARPVLSRPALRTSRMTTSAFPPR